MLTAFLREMFRPKVDEKLVDRMVRTIANGITHGTLWPGFELAQTFNQKGWTGRKQRAAVHAAMHHFRHDVERMPSARPQGADVVAALRASLTHFGKGITIAKRGCYRFRDGSMLAFKGGKWIGTREEEAEAAR